MSNMNYATFINWDGFLSEMSSSFDAGVTNLNIQLDEALTELTGDPSNPELLAKYQSRLSEYTLYRNAQSNVVKVYKDVASAIITNFR
ncbi:type III secretion system needle complex protein [Scandinavium sp. V105_16]|uniref:Type III secretion system needle complex protein n=1 Tax=Scandinavium lactucae TaxID=3095028 RepID=A0AAJ2S4L5_9ENTR|nr:MULTISPECIES: type III secretion system needle complex protein [unclassified Scandinavium]MDX6019551.1 type III secretion system needle complex protein [Scandinavium sp. V105_16]MDX6031010.1 type III secretion system needle complex protein [Scandinavium sp. V105_12]MDX6039881.1 type III secretion system needle complex protein [Scandinavium sp. V105_6]MDX6051884.1 type III secretion system needle complex protein [Scandinavium sp. V105_1]